MSEFKYDLFASYSGADADWVKKLAIHLEVEQHKVWIYQWDIQPAERWQDAIEEAIQTSRKHAVVLSPEVMKSSWIKLECDVMLDLAVSGDRGRFVPLLLKDCDTPLFVRQFQWIDFRDPDQFLLKLNNLIRFLRGQPLPRHTMPAISEIRKTEPNDRQELRLKINKILTYFDEIEMLKSFVCIHLGRAWKGFRRDTIVALIQWYSWPDREDEGLRELLQEAQQYLAQLGAR